MWAGCIMGRASLSDAPLSKCLMIDLGDAACSRVQVGSVLALDDAADPAALVSLFRAGADRVLRASDRGLAAFLDVNLAQAA